MKYHPLLALAACAFFMMGCSDPGPKGKATPEAPATVSHPLPGDTAPGKEETTVSHPLPGDTAAGNEATVPHPLPGDPAAGKEVYTRICSACHQPDGSGLNGMLAANFVSDKTRLAKSNEVLLASVRNGIVADGKVMPPQKDILSDQEIKDALSYIRKTFGGTQ